ncbi:hypothetical protein EWM64_g3131 [Hericium alpestre]|uniref:Extracellular mutant protein 11 C-terminal domain-containing protein n=1 Tax=Hericium alpestre TaxID=135208 RepID=A0A4Z0A5B3_9AGAM|nr:hypothetical protein EWM64_g3131 [Hericium alpestre]
MSARQAFIPSRPASRAGQLNELEIQRPSPGQHQRHNKADANNSSSKAYQQPITRGQENALVQRPQTPMSKHNSDAGLPSDFNKHKPFNVSGLKKNKRDSTGGGHRPDRELLGSMPVLSSSLDHGAHQQRIAEPRPRHSPPLSGHMGNFKTPPMPWMHGSDAHIVGPADETDTLVPNGLLPSPVARRGRLESIQEAQELEEEQEDSGYMSAQMAVGDKGNAGSDAARRLAGLGSKQQGPRRVLKRASVDEGDGQEEASVPRAKRARRDTYDEDDPQEIQILGDGFNFSQNNPNSTGLTQTDNIGQSSGGDLTDLFSRFGLDIDESRIEEYTDFYITEQRRWSEASHEDWRAGSKEIAKEFSDAMDHLTSKVATYDALHATLADHGAVLDARGEMNKKVRESLVRNSGNVLKVVELETTRQKVDKSVGES